MYSNFVLMNMTSVFNCEMEECYSLFAVTASACSSLTWTLLQFTHSSFGMFVNIHALFVEDVQYHIQVCKCRPERSAKGQTQLFLGKWNSFPPELPASLFEWWNWWSGGFWFLVRDSIGLFEACYFLSKSNLFLDWLAIVDSDSVNATAIGFHLQTLFLHN